MWDEDEMPSELGPESGVGLARQRGGGKAPWPEEQHEGISEAAASGVLRKL